MIPRSHDTTASRRRVLLLFIAAALAVAVPTLPIRGSVGWHSGVTGFVDNPTSNSADFNTYIEANGGAVDTVVDFATHPVGPLQRNFYSSVGVMLSGTKGLDRVSAGAGPNQGGANLPRSNGEGQHPK